MLLQKSRLAAPQVERPYLAPLWLVIMLGFLVSIALLFTYPHDDLVRRVGESPDDELSAVYLTNLLRSDPNNPQLRFLLARHQMRLRQYDLARVTVQAAVEGSDPDLRREARWLRWQIGEDELKHAPSPSWEVQQIQMEFLRNELEAFADEDWSQETGLILAGKAFDHTMPDVALQIFKNMAMRLPGDGDAERFFQKAAVDALAHGRYQASAELYIIARQEAKDPQRARQYFHTALRTLQSGNQVASALALGERELGVLADDQDTLLLLTTLARLERRPDIAERYVRRLLKISLLRQWQALQMARAWGPGEWRLVSNRETAKAAAQEPGIAFDEKIYSLGYEVFLDNRKLEDAWQVAASAVRQKPDDLMWRERLAQVSEWSARPAIALQNWLFLARQTQQESAKQDSAWQAVLRLAPGLFDDAALRAALIYQLSKTPQDLKLLKELVAAYEREGDPASAIRYLQQFNRSHPRAETLVLLADLADRAGRVDIAIETWLRLFQNEAEVTPTRAMHLATLLIMQGRGEQALHWLTLAQNRGGDAAVDDPAFLRFVGQVAQQENADALAIQAFARLSRQDKAEATDFDVLIQLLAQTHPLEGARVAERAWERFDKAPYLTQALNLYASKSQWTAMGALLNKLDPDPRTGRRSLLKMRRHADFLLLAGAYQQNTGHLQEARRDYEAGLLMAPDSAPMQQALLWLYIDSNDAPALRRLLASREPQWRNEPGMHDALAAAYLALSRPQVALERYLTPRVAAQQNDFLWMMNYADALDQNHQTDRAWRVRRHLLSQEWQANAAQRKPIEARQRWLTEEGLEQTRRIARTRLLLTQRPGDTGLDALRELLRLDRDADKHYSNSAAELAIGWFQDRAEYSAERAFLWHQYGRSRGKAAHRPLWAEISVALAEEDRAASGQLLEEFGERIPRSDRINAARAAGDVRRAQSEAFETQLEQTDDDDLHMQLSDALLAFSDQAGFALRSNKLGAIDEKTASGMLHVAIDPRLSLDFKFGEVRRQERDSNIVLQPPNEKFTSLKMNWQQAAGETTMLVEQRESFTRYTPLQLEQAFRFDSRLSLRIGLGTQLVSQESLPLRFAGMKDRASFGFTYRPTRLDQIAVEHWVERYSLQTGARVGSGQHSSVALNHAYRQDAGDLQFGLFWSRHHFSRVDDPSGASDRDREFLKYVPGGLPPGAGYFLPDDFRFYGIRVATDMRFEEEYTRATRPFASVSKTWHSSLGPGFDLRLGLAGRLLGTDHLSLSWGLGKSGMQSSGLIRDLQLNYRLHH